MRSRCGDGRVAGAGLTWQVVDVASVHQQVSVFGVAQRRQVPGQRHAGAHVPPQRAWTDQQSRFHGNGRLTTTHRRQGRGLPSVCTLMADALMSVVMLKYGIQRSWAQRLRSKVTGQRSRHLSLPSPRSVCS